jgi:DNA-binding transcriptional LysR family regulator
MDTDYIREFVVLAQTGSFLEAADKLFICQSSLSKHIRVLENELGVPLFDRTTRKVVLTEFGHQFLEFAFKMIQLQREYYSAAYNILQTQQNSVTIGSIPVMAQYGITDVILHFKKDNAGISLNLLEGDSIELKELLRKGKIELAFIRSYNERDDEFTKIHFLDDRLVAIIPANHPLAKSKTVALRQLKDEDLLMLEKGTMLYELCVKNCRREGFEPRVTYTSHRMENTIDLVKKGMGIALMMRKHIPYQDITDVTIADIDPLLSTEICLYYLKEKELSPAAKHFVRCVKMMT